MPNSCVAYNCTSKSKKGTDVSFFRFPLNEKDRLSKWLIALRRSKFEPNVYHRICSKHFHKDSFLKGYVHLRRKLKNDAVPTIFDFPLPLVEKPKIKKKPATKKPHSVSNAKTKKQKKKKIPRKMYGSTNNVKTGDDDGSALKQLPGLSIAIDVAAEITSSDAAHSDILPTTSGETSDGNIDPAVVIRNKFSTFFDFIAIKLHNINDPNMQQLAQIKIVNVLDEIETQLKKQSSSFPTSDQAHIKDFEDGVSDISQALLTNENGKRDYERDSNYDVLNSYQENLTNKNKKQALKSNDFPSQALSVNEKSDYQPSLACNSNINLPILKSNIENEGSGKHLAINVSDSSFDSSPSILKNNVGKQVNSESVLSSITNSYQVISVDEKQPQQQSLSPVANNSDQTNLSNNIVGLDSSESLISIVLNADVNQSVLENKLENIGATESSPNNLSNSGFNPSILIKGLEEKDSR